MVYISDYTKLMVMSFLVFAYFLIELVVGYMLNSLALVADSFHMLSDLVSLLIAIASIKISRWPKSSRNTFGWQRAEVMGSLVNSVMLASLCFVIIIESIQRFFKKEEVEQPKLLLFVGLGGLFINFVGIVVLGLHSHSHGPDGVSHHEDVANMLNDGDSKDSHQHLDEYSTSDEKDQSKAFNLCNTKPKNNKIDKDHEFCHLKSCRSNQKSSKMHDHSSLNMKAVLLHVMADFLGSIIVVISALLLWLVKDEGKVIADWKFYVDPILSLTLVAIILVPLLPLLFKTALILLQSVPEEICIKNLYNRLEKVEGVNHLHDLHVWQLGSKCIIGTVHIRVKEMKERSTQFLSDYEKIVRDVKKMFHEANIHCTTIQLEFEDGEMADNNCIFDCRPNGNCNIDTCCPAKMGDTPNTTNQDQAIDLKTTAENEKNVVMI